MASTTGAKIGLAVGLAAAALWAVGERGGSGPWPAAAEEEPVEILWADKEAEAGRTALVGLCESEPKLGVFLMLRPNEQAGSRVVLVRCPNGPERETEILTQTPPDQSGRPDFRNFAPTLWYWRVNPKCIYMEVGGRKILVKGDPNLCL